MAYDEFVTVKYIEIPEPETDLFGENEAETGTDPEEILVLVDDLYEELAAVMAGTRSVPFRIETRGDVYIITPNNPRVGTSFPLPKNPDAFQSFVDSWKPGVEGRSYKLAVHDEFFIPTSEEE